jgi:hypothetical protein
MGFFTIFVTDDLSERDYRRALRAGPSTVSSRRRAHDEMLASAGFTSVEEIPLTDEFLQTTRAWYYGRERYATEIAAAEGEAGFQERQADSLAQLEAIEAGLLRRSLFIAR